MHIASVSIKTMTLRRRYPSEVGGQEKKMFKNRELKRNSREPQPDRDPDRKYSLRPFFPLLPYLSAC